MSLLEDTLHQDSMTQVKTIWDLELFEFMLVDPTFLLERPYNSNVKELETIRQVKAIKQFLSQFIALTELQEFFPTVKSIMIRKALVHLNQHLGYVLMGRHIFLSYVLNIESNSWIIHYLNNQ